MLTMLYRAAALWTTVGLAGGLFYREFTEKNNHPGGTQLALVHTHSLVLGTLVMLLLIALVATLPGLARDGRFKAAFWVWQAGLLDLIATLTIKGCFQVLHDPRADNKALSGIAGMGHIALTVAFLLLFVALAPAVRRAQQRLDAGEGPDAAGPAVAGSTGHLEQR